MKVSRDPEGSVGVPLDTPSLSQLVPFLLNRTVDRFNRVWLTRLREHGMTVARWQVLAVLVEYDGSRLGVLAEMSGTDQPVMSRVVDQMERDRLVKRRPARSDGRAVEVWLTKRGRDLFAELTPEASDVVSAALRGLERAAIEQLAEALVHVTANLDALGARESWSS